MVLTNLTCNHRFCDLNRTQKHTVFSSTKIVCLKLFMYKFANNST